MADQSPLDLHGTLNRMEEGIAPVDLIISMASIAMSLKRIADCMDNEARRLSLQASNDWASANNITQAINNLNLRSK